MTIGDLLEVLGLPPRVPWVMRNGVRQVKVDDKRWVDLKSVWRPAIYGGPNGRGHVFRWTDNMHFVVLPTSALATQVRTPRGSTASQERYVEQWGDLW